MTILSIDEAAAFLRVSKRSLYRHRDIPGRAKIGNQIVYVKEHLEAWILQQCGPVIAHDAAPTNALDPARRPAYHRSPALRRVRS